MTHEPRSSDPAKSDAAGDAAKIVFHCANGHRIEAAASHAGKRGKCSKCGVEVVIPTPETFALPGPVAPFELGGPYSPPRVPPSPVPEPSPQPQSVDMFADLAAAAEERPSSPGLVDLTFDGPARDVPAVAATAANPTAALVARLFQEVEHGGVVEVHVTGGSVILPEFYDARWSAGAHGLFASRAADGTITLTAVAWDSIQKIIVRQVDGLPDGMFD